MTSLEDWLAALSEHLGVDLPPDLIPPVLDLARDAAHAVVRPAAPLSAFVAGYAAGLASAQFAPAERMRELTATVERARTFAVDWSSDD